MSTHVKNLKLVTLLMSCLLGFIVSQNVSWKRRKSEDCLRHNLDHIQVEAVISRTISSYDPIVAKGAAFECLSKPLCEITDLDKTCSGNQNSICYCESATYNETLVVLKMLADVKFSEQNISVRVPCVEKEESTWRQITLPPIIKYKHVFKLNGQEVKDSSSVLYHYNPFHIELCCNQEIADFDCTSIINNQFINASGTPCASLRYFSVDVTNYTLSIEVCGKTQVIKNITFIPLSDVDNSKQDITQNTITSPWQIATIAIVLVFIVFICLLLIKFSKDIKTLFLSWWKKTKEMEPKPIEECKNGESDKMIQQQSDPQDVDVINNRKVRA